MFSGVRETPIPVDPFLHQRTNHFIPPDLRLRTELGKLCFAGKLKESNGGLSAPPRSEMVPKQGRSNEPIMIGGEIVYRVDNYEKKCSNEVHLMDLRGRILFTIRRRKIASFLQKLHAFGCWDGYSKTNKDNPCFKVKKYCRMMRGEVACRITVGYVKYWIIRLAGKAAFRIVDAEKKVVAEAKPKHSSSGVVLGDDVLILEVVPRFDHSFVMALVIVYGLIQRSL
ncbi:Protein LURP-one-related 4 [Morella rubra]|uniref:Protein LURP-one-related 4 n=1 Tax=Morella rubra TaxID=262757 RepID=A0A6A1WFU9_9ROSI|nr:Protein LURP-one-related 4 [Morella rubra]